MVELPLRGVKFTRLLSSAGDWSGTLPLGAKVLSALDPINTTKPNEVELVIQRDGKVAASGLITDREYNSDTQELKLAGHEGWFYFDRRLIDSDLTYAPLDQGLIVQDLLTRAAIPPQGDFRVDLPSTAAFTTGVTRTIGYLQVDCKPISEAVEELASMLSGFEFSLDGYWSGNTFRHAFNFGFPLRGVRGGALTQWDLPGAITSYRWQEQGSEQANEVFGTGDDGTGHVALKRIKTFRRAQPLLQRQVSYRAVTDSGTLLSWTQQQAARMADPVVAAFVTVKGDLLPALGDYGLGDDVTFQFNDPRFNNVSSIWRLAGWTVTTADKGGSESVNLLVIST